MSDAIPIDLSTTDHLVDPPIVDFLAYDKDLKAFVAEFVPDPAFSPEQKESVYLYDGTDSARRVLELLAELTRVLQSSLTIVKVAHAGRGNFSFYTGNGKLIELHDTNSPQQTMDAYAVLQTLSQEIQLEFVTQRRAEQRRAV